VSHKKLPFSSKLTLWLCLTGDRILAAGARLMLAKWGLDHCEVCVSKLLD
jgi:hypothetical protein